jgi:hypothetical protein
MCLTPAVKSGSSNHVHQHKVRHSLSLCLSVSVDLSYTCPSRKYIIFVSFISQSFHSNEGPTPALFKETVRHWHETRCIVCVSIGAMMLVGLLMIGRLGLQSEPSEDVVWVLCMRTLQWSPLVSLPPPTHPAFHIAALSKVIVCSLSLMSCSMFLLKISTDYHSCLVSSLHSLKRSPRCQEGLLVMFGGLQIGTTTRSFLLSTAHTT